MADKTMLNARLLQPSAERMTPCRAVAEEEGAPLLPTWTPACTRICLVFVARHVSILMGIHACVAHVS